MFMKSEAPINEDILPYRNILSYDFLLYSKLNCIRYLELVL